MFGCDQVGDGGSSGENGPSGGPLDLRLLPPAGGLWLGVALVLLTQSGSVTRFAGIAGIALAAAAAAASAGSLALRRRQASQPRWAVPAVVALVTALLGAGLGALHLVRVQPTLVADLVDQGAVVRVTAAVTGDPQAHWPANQRWATTTTWTAQARVERLEVRARTYRVRLPVQLRGAAVRTLAHGSTVSLTGRVRPAWSRYEQSMTLQVLGAVQVRSGPSRLARTANAIRGSFRESVSGLTPDSAALLLGLAVGDESLLPLRLDEAMTVTGLAHLTAVSGSNCSLVVGLALGMVAALGLGWRTRGTACLVVLLAYVVLVRPQPSVLRAAAMGSVGVLALTAGGRRRGPPALFAAIVVLLIAYPTLALSWGFALSVAATGGLLLVGPHLAARLAASPLTRWVPAPVRAALAVSTAAHMATLPLAVALGNGASWVALPANVVVTPLVPFATVVGLGAALASPVLPGAAEVLARLGSPATAAIAWVAHTGAAVPGAVLPLPGSPVGVLTAIALVLVVGASLARRWRPWRDWRLVSVAGVLAACLAVAAHVRDGRWPPPAWIVLACDVGQGDGVLVRAPGSTSALLVDVGPVDADVAACVEDAGIERVAVVLTHFHADHVDGLSDLLDRVPVDLLLTSPVPIPRATAREVLSLAVQAGVRLRPVRAGDQLQWAGMAAQVLWPARAMPEANNASAVLLVTVPGAGGSTRVLLTGDIEPEAQAAVLARGLPAADVVKVPHHGSRHQDPELARRSGATIALVSVGEGNAYGHPAEQTLAQYREAGAQIGRTDLQGALAVVATARGVRLEVQHR